MKNSVLLRRIILLLLFTVLLSGALTTGIYIFITQRMYINMKSEELAPIARTVAEMITNEQESGMSGRGVWPLLDRENRNFLGASLHIYDARGESIMNPSDRGLGGARTLPPPDESLFNQMLQEDLYDTLTGKEVAGVKKDGAGISFLVVGVPIFKVAGNTDSVSGAVIFTKPMSELNDTQKLLNLTLLISMLAAFAVMLVPGYFAARLLALPIRQMREVARSMAKGDFSKRADESQKGEIGELGHAMNRFAEEYGRLEQTRQDYVANVSHELRTPVAAIRAMGETLRDGMAKTPEKQGLFYNNIVRESLRLSRLIDDLLELSRLQTGAGVMQKLFYNLHDVLRNAIDIYGHIAEDAGLEFFPPAGMETPVPVFGSPDRVEQILVILLDNAVKHASEGGKISLYAADKGDVVEVCVANTGDDISAEDMPNIFDRFYKTDKSHSGDGFGLGLSIAKEIIYRLGENIWAESGGGVTRFVFTVNKRDRGRIKPVGI